MLKTFTAMCSCFLLNGEKGLLCHYVDCVFDLCDFHRNFGEMKYLNFKIKRLWAFYSLYAVFIVTMLVLLVSNTKADLHLWMTSVHTDNSDVFFKYCTEVGGWIPFLVAAALLFYRYKAGILLCVAQLFTGLVGQLGKWIWNEPRPKLYFEQYYPEISLHQVAGVHLHSYNSFPSGHTTAVFSMFLVLATLTNKKPLHALYLVLAVLVGYSRIYLSQHFAVDVLVGSMVGVAFTLPCNYWVEKLPQRWADGSLRDVFSRK